MFPLSNVNGIYSEKNSAKYGVLCIFAHFSILLIYLTQLKIEINKEIQLKKCQFNKTK